MRLTKAILSGLLAFAATLAGQTNQSIFPLQPPVSSTVPSNGDVNPYGIVIIPKTISASSSGLQPGDVLVSNFNNNQNLQGVGRTIIRVDAAGNRSTFFTSAGAKTGLTAALGVLTNGLVLIGNLPTLDGTAATVQPGTIQVLDRFGDFLGTIGDPTTVDGPWGMAVQDLGNNGTGTAHVYVSNVLSGKVVRFDLNYTPFNIGATVTIIAAGFNHRTDPAALVLGPSGLAYSASNDTLYVASSEDNAIYAIPTASKTSVAVTQTLVFSDLTHLHGPLDLAILPDGHFVVANSDGSNADPNQPSELVEFTAAGQFLNQMSIDPNNGGAFGLAVLNVGWGTVRMAAVDDNQNTLNLWTVVVP
ncbi:MAG TPA: hypothetical protein VKB79_26640 [Bryobacteraceae bacterium]|nr:hypothetical protein [Bryobacteraceae bacterium]